MPPRFGVLYTRQYCKAKLREEMSGDKTMYTYECAELFYHHTNIQAKQYRAENISCTPGRIDAKQPRIRVFTNLLTKMFQKHLTKSYALCKACTGQLVEIQFEILV